MAIIYSLAAAAVVIALTCGMLDMRSLKRKVNGQFTKSITPDEVPHDGSKH